MRWVAALALLAAWLPSGAVAQGSGATGIDAFVVRVPPDIVCIRAPCRAPVAGVSVSFVRDGKVVARIVSGNDGHARARLAPGRYVVRAPGVTALPGGKPRQVKVASGRVTRITLPLDAKRSTTGSASDQ